MPYVTLYIATSLDGYIARADDGIDWLSIVEKEGEDYGYGAFYDSVDALIMGRRTYELVRSFSDWPYPEKQSLVFTHRDLATGRDDVEVASGDVKTVLAAMEARGYRRLWLVGGGELTRAFLQQGLIDEYIISILPILLGGGLPLFPPPGLEQRLELASAKQYPSGLVQLHYRVGGTG
jgi:dihydrofolate reductase